MKYVSSSQNPIVKDILKLQEKSRERKKRGLFIIEGMREVSLAIQGGYEITTVLFPENEPPNTISQLTDAELIAVSTEVYKKIAYRESTEAIVAIAKAKDIQLADLTFKNDTPLVLVAESIEKPGNIGAMLRTADAANVDAVILADPKTDLYNPNVIRSSVGCLFTNQVVMATSEDAIRFLHNKGIHIFGATLQNSNDYSKESYTGASAIVVGTEATGLSNIWREMAYKNINIPMEGAIDSMNVSVAAAILIFEAKRQRKG